MNINRATLFPGMEGLARSRPLRLLGLSQSEWGKAISTKETKVDRVVPPDAAAIRW
jgi:hypothetical protein